MISTALTCLRQNALLVNHKIHTRNIGIDRNPLQGTAAVLEHHNRLTEFLRLGMRLVLAIKQRTRPAVIYFDY